MTFHVDSEVGVLKQVVLHRPGLELERLTPNNCEKLLFDDVMACVHQLPPQYRLVFNLFAIEGKSHRDIAAQLGITEGTSKSNFAKARQKLMLLLKHKGY